MNKNTKIIFIALKIIFIAGILTLSAAPYFLNISQDLPEPVSHDEAAFHLNSKDIVLFGASSLKNDRLTSVIFPLNALLGLISFSISGCSLFSMRIPYILLNVLGNILFFDLIRRTRGLFTASAALLAFAFYYPRLIIGKSAMAESLTLPLVLILIWCFVYVFHSARTFFWIGVLGVLILCSKLDNIFVPIFLTGFACLKFFVAWRKGDHHNAKRIIIFYLSGTCLALAIWFFSYIIIGWEKTVFQFKYALIPNLNLSYEQGSALSPFTVKLFLKNIGRTYAKYPGLLLVIAISIIPFFSIFACSKEERRNPLAWAVLLVIFLFLGKHLASTIFHACRIAPCHALVFLLVAHIAGFLIQGLNTKIHDAVKICLASMFLFMSFYICYMPDVMKKSLNRVFSPGYDTLKQARVIDSILDKRYKALFLDGRFSYIALQIPVKFIDIKPDLNAKEFYQMESNPPLTRKLLTERPDIKYVFFRTDNKTIKKMIEEEFHGRQLMEGSMVGGYGVLYEIPQKADDVK